MPSTLKPVSYNQQERLEIIKQRRKNNMSTLLTVGILGAVVFIGIWLFLSIDSAYKYADDQNVVGVPASYVGNHTITVNADSYTKILNYALNRKITIADSTDFLIKDSGKKIVVWRWQDISSPDVVINLVHKKSDNPLSYELVRMLSVKTPNSGSYSWVSLSDENMPNLYIQIGCSVTPNQCKEMPLIPTI